MLLTSFIVSTLLFSANNCIFRLNFRRGSQEAFSYSTAKSCGFERKAKISWRFYWRLFRGIFQHCWIKRRSIVSFSHQRHLIQTHYYWLIFNLLYSFNFHFQHMLQVGRRQRLFLHGKVKRMQRFNVLKTTWMKR